MTRSILNIAAVAATCGLAASAQAAIVGPYSVDANTLHLWHINETATPVVDSVAGGQNLNGLLGGATLGNASASGVNPNGTSYNFGNALNTNGPSRILLAAAALSNGGAAAGADSVTLRMQDATTRQFTYEAIVRLDFDTTATRTAGMHIIGGEGEGAERIFQFRLNPLGVAGATGVTNTIRLEFNPGLGQSVGAGAVFATVPSTGVNAAVQGGTYHVAVSYSGAGANNMSFYWTKLDPATTTANLIGTVTQGGPVAINNNGVTGGNSNTDLSIGNEARSTGGESEPFLGLVDEVRISGVVRTADQFIFAVPEPTSIASLALASAFLARRRRA